MTTMTEPKAAELVPFALKDAPSLIEKVFPATKVSYEAQKERKANLGQTLTGLGSYWKGRKPLILVKAIVLGSLLPHTDDEEGDLEVFEGLMALDKNGLARRAVAQNKLRPKQLAMMVEIENPRSYFTLKRQSNSPLSEEDVASLTFPIDADRYGLTVQWRSDACDTTKAFVYGKALDAMDSYETRASICKRPEEVDDSWLYEPIWEKVNAHYSKFGVAASSHKELVSQLGVLRFGKRPRLGDVFSGGGSIPFEAARVGCDVYASDLNPVACMLNWANIHTLGAEPKERERIEEERTNVIKSAERRVSDLGYEKNSRGDQAKVYLYCLEFTCPETGWKIPLSGSWVISKTKNIIAKLRPNPKQKCFDIDIVQASSDDEVSKAEMGAVQNGKAIYSVEGKEYTLALKSLRGDAKDKSGATRNNVRPLTKEDISYRPEDIFRERLYCIQWVLKDTIEDGRPTTYFAAPTEEDFEAEEKVEKYIKDRMQEWLDKGFLPASPIEVGGPPRYQGRSMVLNVGWTHWHHAYTPRQLMVLGIIKEEIAKSEAQAHLIPFFFRCLDANSKLCRWDFAKGQDRVANTFSNQALNPLYNFPARSLYHTKSQFLYGVSQEEVCHDRAVVTQSDAASVEYDCDLWVTDPPYADAVMYDEISDFFICWMKRGSVPATFSKWRWDARRSLAIRGAGDEFRKGMVEAYSNMAQHMPDNGMQCVMFTHQDTGVWSDMVGIFWAAGLQVVGAWYIATETTSELKKGGYVQGTVILMLRKRPAGDRPGFTRRIYPAVHQEVGRQIEEMLHLNQQIASHTGEPVFNDADLQMAGYAAALKVLTSFTEIGGEDVTMFALRPRKKGEATVVDQIVQQASETANSLLVPDGLSREAWQTISGIQRFYLRLADIETTGASKLDNYQNFAKAFRVEDYTKVMASMSPTKARLKQVQEFAPRELMDTTELGATHLGRLIAALQQLLDDTPIKSVVQQLAEDLTDYFEKRGVLEELARFLSVKSPDEGVRDKAEILADRIHNDALA